MSRKKVLLFSYNPVPTPEYTTIEGSALRFWRMAMGLQEHSDYDITIAIWDKFPQKYTETEGFHITNFNADSQALKKLAKGFDAVVFSCAMGNLSKTIYDALDPTSTTIIDAYSPMYVEFLTKSTNKTEDDQWLSVYEEYITVFNELLAKADYILIGNNHQKHFYRGVLGATGALVDHDDSRFIMLPAFVESSKNQSHAKRVSKEERLNVLWFGGVYPWFDINDLIKAFSNRSIRQMAKLTIVGGSNPFYPKDNKRFNGKYIAAIEQAEKLNLIKDGTVVLKDWVKYEDRIKEFEAADVAITINNTFLENEYSFRLRVADLAGNGVPIITNGGDCLGEDLIARGLAFRLDTEVPNMTKGLEKILRDRVAIERVRRQLYRKEAYDSLHIYQYVSSLAHAIKKAKKNKAGYAETEHATSGSQGHGSAGQEFTINSVNGVTTARVLRVAAIRLKRAVLTRLGVRH